MKYLSSFLFFISILHTLHSQNIGIGTNQPEEILHVQSMGTINAEIKLESADTTGMKIVPGTNMPYLHRIYRNDRFDQGFLFETNKLEIHTGWGKQFFNGPYLAYPSLKIDDLGRTGVRMISEEPSQALDVKGKLKIADDSFTPSEGVIKWDGNNFLGYDGLGWRSFLDMNDADNDTRIYLHEGQTDSIIMQANGAGKPLIFDGTRLTISGDNVFIGDEAGAPTTTGSGNIAIGREAGKQISSGNNNTLLGLGAGEVFTTGKRNAVFGAGALSFNTVGDENVALGFSAGRLNTGTGNVFIGNDAGYFSSGNNQLFIANTNTNAPLIHGNFQDKMVTINEDLTVKDELVVEDIAHARQIQLTDVNPILRFNSSNSTTQFDFYYDNNNDRLVIDEEGTGQVMQIKNGDIYLPALADNYTRGIEVLPNGKLELASERQTLNYFNLNDCVSSSASEARVCNEGITFRNGQVLTKLEAWMADGSSNHNVSVSLRRLNKLDASTIETIFSVVSTNNGGVAQLYTDTTSAVAGGEIIDNSTYIYILSATTTHFADGVSFTWVSEVSVE